jgi:hypothetical protein
MIRLIPRKRPITNNLDSRIVVAVCSQCVAGPGGGGRTREKQPVCRPQAATGRVADVLSVGENLRHRAGGGGPDSATGMGAASPEAGPWGKAGLTRGGCGLRIRAGVECAVAVLDCAARP